MISYSTIWIWILLSFISISSLQHVAIAEINKKFVPYENTEFGFRILYPSGWHAFEFSPLDRVGCPDCPPIYFGPAGYIESLLNSSEFISPGSNTSLSIKVDNVSKYEYLDTNTLTVKTAPMPTAHDYAMDRINELSGGGIREHYLRDMPVSVGTAHIPGWRVDSMYSGEPGYNSTVFGDYVISTYLVSDSKVYTFTYEDLPLRVPDTLPLMQTMLNSFQVIK